MTFFPKPITVHAADLNKFKKKEMMKKRPHVKNAWYDWLVNYIHKPVKNSSLCYRKHYEPF